MPKKTMTRLTALACLAIFSLSACATVDVTAIGSPDAEVTQLETTEQQGNVITRAVMRLQSVFIDKGWHEDRSRENVQSAANILLNGLKETTSSSLKLINASSNTNMLLDDIKTASYHISQTTKAAEVYMDVASSDANLKPELKQLEKALRLSEEAHGKFQDQFVVVNLTSEMEQLSNEIELLRVITDDFGDVVRTRSIAVNNASAS